MLKSLEIKNFTAFGSADLQFAKGLNVFVGENGTGKTHLLKLPYAVMATSAEGRRRGDGNKPVKAPLQRDIAEKLMQVFRPESLGRLTRRQIGRNRCEIVLQFDRKRDTCLLLGAPTLKGSNERRANELLEPLEEQMGGRVVLDPNGRFYLKLPGVGNLEAHLVAEGLRKLAMLARLIATGSLLDQGCLFWDEPESNLNSKLVRGVAEAILGICSEGIQVFVATHSLFLLRELEMLLEQQRFNPIQQRYFALAPGDDGVAIQQGDRIDDVDPLVALDEELEQSGRFLDSSEGATT